MSTQPSRPAPNDAKEQAAADTQSYRATLHELIGMGADIARTLHKQALAQAQPAPAPGKPDTQLHDAATAFDRIARCVRRTILLAQHIGEPRPAPVSPDRAATPKRIPRGCDDNIDNAALQARKRGGLDTDADRPERLERLDSPELADGLDIDIANRPTADIIAEIRGGLGLGLDDRPGRCPARRRTPADIALPHARAANLPGTARPAPPTAPRPAPAPENEPPDMADMLALCAALVRDG